MILIYNYMKMKNILFILAIILSPIFVYGKGETVYTRLQSFYSNASMVTIDKVVMSDTATVMYCTVRGKINSRFQFAPTVYLSDEEAVRYPVKGAVGLKLGQKCYIPKTGEITFRLLFEPMRKDTKIFDLIEGADKGMFRIYGIHDAKSKVKIPVAKEEIDADETAEALFHRGNAVIKGRIEGYSRNWNAGLLFFDYNLLGQCDIMPYPLCRPCTILSSDGTFSMELPLDHPVWGSMSLSGGNKEIPFYIRPNDTLWIDVKGLYENNLTVEYKSSHPKGCYENLMQHQNVPVVYCGWDFLTDYGRNLDSEHFLKKSNECVEQNMRICDYMAWKYKLSPWETHLLKNRQRFDLADHFLLLASRLFEAKVVRPQKVDLNKEDYAGYDYSPYKVLNMIEPDDPSLSYLLFSPGYLPSIDITYAMAFADSYAYYDNMDGTNPGDPMKMEIQKDSLQIEALRELFGRKDTPWFIQAFITAKATRLDDRLNEEQRERVISFLSSYLTYPYFKDKIEELDKLSGHSVSQVYEIPEMKSNQDIQKILEEYKGQYVQLVLFSSPDEDFSFYENSSVRNLLASYENDPNLRIIALVNRDAYSENEYLRDRLNKRFRVIYDVNGENYLKIQHLFHLSGSHKQITIDRNGLVFKQPFDMKEETQFRNRFRTLLEAENSIRPE